MPMEGAAAVPSRVADAPRAAVGPKGASSRPSFMTKLFDLPGPVPLRRSYIVASTPRCGSAFLCSRLSATGILGAPAEYFGYHKRDGEKVMTRLAGHSPTEYPRKLLARRTSKNGVFGLNIEFNDFEEALRRFPDLLITLSPITYIFVDREDRIVQAAFMAKAVQRSSRPDDDADSGIAAAADGRAASGQGQAKVAQYDRDLISKWLGRIERQKLAWMRWFDRNSITPSVVTYSNLITNPTAAVRSIVELIGVQNDERQNLRVALAERPTDRISIQWAARFEREITSGILTTVTPAGRSAPHIFDRFDEIKGESKPTAAKRLRRRHEAIIVRNRDLFKNARVLDLRSGDGCWSFAALQAGAAHVTGIDSKPTTLAVAKRIFTKLNVRPESYRFDNKKVLDALHSFSPDTFDVILCREVSPDPHYFFRCLRQLRPKHVVLDTKIIGRKRPSAAFRLRQDGKSGQRPGARSASLVAAPAHALIARLCDHFGFRCRLVDWHALGMTDWTGVDDYQRGRRRTYVLDLIARPERPRS
jgi:LPS sulfotransferase NodH